MKTIYILFLVFNENTQAIEFNSIKACQDAGKHIKDDLAINEIMPFGGTIRREQVKYYCLKK